jgi:hypothetical protein
MIRVVTFVSVLTMFVCGITTDATAQMYIRPSSGIPATEVAVVTSGSNFFEPPVGFGARVTVNRSDWFGTEASLDTTKARAFEPAHSIFVLNARVIVAPEPDSFWTLTAGGAVGTGLRRPLTPMVGVGFQHLLPDDLFAVRVDVQCFPGGLIHQRTDRRLTIGVVLLVH